MELLFCACAAISAICAIFTIVSNRVGTAIITFSISWPKTGVFTQLFFATVQTDDQNGYEKQSIFHKLSFWRFYNACSTISAISAKIAIITGWSWATIVTLSVKFKLARIFTIFIGIKFCHLFFFRFFIFFAAKTQNEQRNKKNRMFKKDVHYYKYEAIRFN